MTDDTLALLNRERELAVTDGILEECRKVLRLIPECPMHGEDCLPHAKEWIEKHLAAERVGL